MLKIFLILFFTLLTQFALGFDRKTYLAMGDQELFLKAMAYQVGECAIRQHTLQSGITGYTALSFQQGHYMKNERGLPSGQGLGIVVGPAFTECMDLENNHYKKYNETSTPICTADQFKNGANMIRIGLAQGFCDDDVKRNLDGSTEFLPPESRVKHY